MIARRQHYFHFFVRVDLVPFQSRLKHRSIVPVRIHAALNPRHVKERKWRRHEPPRTLPSFAPRESETISRFVDRTCRLLFHARRERRWRNCLDATVSCYLGCSGGPAVTHPTTAEQSLRSIKSPITTRRLKRRRDGAGGDETGVAMRNRRRFLRRQGRVTFNRECRDHAGADGRAPTELRTIR